MRTPAPAPSASSNPHRLLVVMPTWLGDCVMATPTLRALRTLYPQAHLTALVARPLRPILEACPWLDEVLDPGDDHAPALARRLRQQRFDTALLLPNSFRSALLIALARIPRRIGYDRDGRGWLLTDRLIPRKHGGAFVKVPTRDYYLALVRYLGADDPDPAMQLVPAPEHDQAVDALLRRAGHDSAGDRPLVLLNPGANFGDAKMWFPDRFAAVADLCARELNATVAVTGAPKERPILDAVLETAEEPVVDLPELGLSLAMLPSVVARASVLVTNDTGPRHLAAALGTPVVTIFGPTDPAWTIIGFERERQVMVNVPCGPCQLKQCPLDHRCMTQVSPAMVFEKVRELMGEEKQESKNA